jgi:3-oxoacyl-[acyl-carrier protein] reductase
VSKELQGKVALVTGAGRNIGRAIALALADAGAAVVLNARSSRSEIDAVAAEIKESLPFMADVTDEAAVRRMIEATLKRFGRLDILVNNAAVRGVEPIESIDLKRWRSASATSAARNRRRAGIWSPRPRSC